MSADDACPYTINPTPVGKGHFGSVYAITRNSDHASLALKVAVRGYGLKTLYFPDYKI